MIVCVMTRPQQQSEVDYISAKCDAVVATWNQSLSIVMAMIMVKNSLSSVQQQGLSL